MTRPPGFLPTVLCFLVLSSPASSEDLPVFLDEGVSLTGTLSDGSAVEVVTKDEWAASGATDLASVLEGALNLPLNRNGAYGTVAGAGIRGMGSGRVAFLINGVPVNSAQNGTFDLNRLDLNALEKIEVIRGGADTRYGISGAVGGVVNLVTVPRPRAGLHGSVQGSSLSYLPSDGVSSAFDTQGARASLTWGGPVSWALDASAHGAANRYGYRTDEGNPQRWTNNGVWDAGGGGSVTWTPTGAKIHGSFRGNYAQKAVPGPGGYGLPGSETDFSTLASLQVGADRVGTDDLGTDLLVSHDHTAMTWAAGSTVSHHDLDTLGWRNEWTWSVSPQVLLAAAIDGELALLSSTDVGLVRQSSAGLVLTPTIAWGPQFDLTPSVKLVVGPGVPLFAVPKLGLEYRFDQGLVLRNNYFRTFKLPTINDRLWPDDGYSAGNPGLRPEDGLGADVTAQGRVGTGTFDAALHGAYQTEAILWQSRGSRWRPENLGRALLYGLDAGLKLPWGNGLSAEGRYSLLLTNLLTDGLTWADQRRMPYKPLHTFGLTVRWRWDTGSASVHGHHESSRYTSTLNLYRLPAFTTVDLAFEQSLGAGLTVFASWNNALNEGYQTVEGYPLPGAALTAGLRVSG